MNQTTRKKPMQRLQTRCVIGLCVIFMLGQWGCASQPPYYLLPKVRASLGTIGVVSAQYTPALEFELPAKGWGGGAARGAVGGSKAFIMLAPLGAVGVLAIFALRPDVAVGAAAVLLGGVGYLIIGPFYGAATAEDPATVEEAEAQLKAGLVSMRIQETMRDHVIQAAQTDWNVDLTMVDGQGPENASDLLTYFPIQESHIDSVLELRVNRMWLSPKPSFFEADPIEYDQVLQINPTLSLGMEVRGRLIRTADKVVLYDNTWEYEGGSRLFTEWAAHAAQPFAEEFVKAYDELASQIVKTMFGPPPMSIYF